MCPGLLNWVDQLEHLGKKTSRGKFFAAFNVTKQRREVMFYFYSSECECSYLMSMTTRNRSDVYLEDVYFYFTVTVFSNPAP